MTSLYVAGYQGSCWILWSWFTGKKLKLSSMIDLSRGLFSAEDIGEMECNMLSRLSWRRQVNPITPSSLVALEFASFVEGALLAMCVGTWTTWQLGFPERAECGATSKVLLRLKAQVAWISVLHVLSIVQQRSYDICRIFYSGLKSNTVVSI